MTAPVTTPNTISAITVDDDRNLRITLPSTLGYGTRNRIGNRLYDDVDGIAYVDDNDEELIVQLIAGPVNPNVLRRRLQRLLPILIDNPDAPLPEPIRVTAKDDSFRRWVVETNYRNTDAGLLEALSESNGGSFIQPRFLRGGYNLSLSVYGSDWTTPRVAAEARRAINEWYGLNGQPFMVTRQSDEEYEGRVELRTNRKFKGAAVGELLKQLMLVDGVYDVYPMANNHGFSLGIANEFFVRDTVTETASDVIRKFVETLV
jgi:hypothetical protein